MQTALRNAALAVAKVARQALAQDENTPEQDRLSLRVLLEEALPLLEQMSQHEEAAS